VSRNAPGYPHAGTVLAIASLGFFLITLDISIVNVALASIEGDLGGGTAVQQLVSTPTPCCSQRCCCSPGTSPTGSAPRGPWASASPPSR